MFKTRMKKLEEEAKKEPDYVPTKELKPTEEVKEVKRFPLAAVIIVGTILLLAIICIIIICCFGGPVK